MTDSHKHMMFYPGLCGHFAAGSLSKAYLKKDDVFEMHDKNNKVATHTKIPTYIKLDTDINDCIISKYVFV